MVAEVIDFDRDDMVSAIERTNAFAAVLEESGISLLVIQWALAHTASQVDSKILDSIYEEIYPEEE